MNGLGKKMNNSEEQIVNIFIHNLLFVEIIEFNRNIFVVKEKRKNVDEKRGK